MDTRTVNNMPSAATHDEAVRCLMAIELSKKSWIIGVNTPLSDKIGKHTVNGWKELRELLDKLRTRVVRELKRPVEFVSCYEAGYDGFWIHRLLEKDGVRNYVIDPASVQVDRRARRVKTDNVDVTKLLRSLMAYLRGEPKVWSVVRVPTIAEEDDRRLHRERDRLINERVQHVNRIKGLCAVHGVYYYEPLRLDRMKRLEQLQTGDGRELPPRVKAEIRRELQRLELVLQMIKAIEKERNVMALGKTSSTYGNAKKVQQLVKIGSIGPEIATVLVGEVFFRQFNNRQQVGSYVGLTPSHFQSGPSSRDQGISKAGNPKARTIMLELAWFWIRYQPDSPLTIWFRERVGTAKGRIRRIAIVAVARKNRHLRHRRSTMAHHPMASDDRCGHRGCSVSISREVSHVVDKEDYRSRLTTSAFGNAADPVKYQRPADIGLLKDGASRTTQNDNCLRTLHDSRCSSIARLNPQVAISGRGAFKSWPIPQQTF